MGWQDRIRNVLFAILTGDGKIYYPDWKPGETTKDFNATVFEFIKQPGSLVVRKEPKSQKFPVTFWFQGDDCIDKANAFMISANDNRSWIMHHPYYGDITGHPLSISRNDSAYNVSEITVDFWESINTTSPVLKIPIADGTTTKVNKFHTIAPTDYASKVKPTVADKSKMQDSVTTIDALTNKILTAVYYTDYQQIKSQTFSAVDKLVDAPAAAISALQTLILAPANFELAIQSRAEVIIAQFNDFLSLLSSKSTKADKLYFEMAAGTAVAALAQTFINPIDGDYVIRQDVLNASLDLSNLYSKYLTELDALYVKDPNPNNSYAASAATQDALQDLVIFALAGLEEIAFNAKQERTVILDKDSNLIVTVHKYLGLDKEDINIEMFRKINKFKNNNLFILKKGTPIKYYV